MFRDAVGNECRGTDLLTHRMLTPQAHPMNDGLSLYPQAGAVSLSPPDLYSGKMRDRSRLGVACVRRWTRLD